MFKAKDPGGGGQDWEPVPAGVYQAVCYAVVDLGTQFDPNFGTQKHQCWISWEFPNERITLEIDGESVNKPRVISQFFTVSLHEKSNLRQVLESWRGRGFTDEELQGFDLSSLFGANAQINVIHKPKKGGGMKAVIGSIMPISSGMKKFESENEYIYFSFEEHGREVTENIPDGIKSIIMKSREWNESGQQNHVLKDSKPWGNNDEVLPPVGDPPPF